MGALLVEQETSVALFGKTSPEELVHQAPARLQRELWGRLKRIALYETRLLKMSGEGTVVSRNDVVEKLLQDAVAEYERTNADMLLRYPEIELPEEKPPAKTIKPTKPRR